MLTDRFDHKPHLQWRLTLILFAIACSLVVIGAVVFTVYERRNMRLLYNAFYETLSAFSGAVERELAAVERLSLEILADEQFQDLMGRMSEGPPPFQWRQHSEQLARRLQLYTRLHYVEAIIGIDAGGGVTNSRTDYPPFAEVAGPVVERWFATAEESRRWFPRSAAENRLLFARRVREIRGLSFRRLGDLVLIIDKSQLARATAGSPFDDYLELAVIAGNQLIYTNGPAVAAILSGDTRPDTRFNVVNLEGQRYYLAEIRRPSRGLTFVYAIPYDLLFSGVQRFNVILIMVAVGLLLVFLGVSWWTARFFSAPIVALARRMSLLEEADFRALPQQIRTYTRQDEIGTLYREFGIMLERIDFLITEGYQTQIALKDTQFRSLQAQINPHFLYNTLDSINWIAQLEGQESISSMVQSLGTLLRASIESGNTAITIADEVDLLEKYIIIQDTRFGQRLRVDIGVDEDCRVFAIPKLTLQPLVENSIKYGLERLTRPCEITLRVYRSAGRIVVVVGDNGPGMTPEFAASVMNGEVEPSGTGVGIRNIRERLLRLFGADADLSIATIPDQGTTVTIVIPPVSVDTLSELARGVDANA